MAKPNEENLIATQELDAPEEAASSIQFIIFS